MTQQQQYQRLANLSKFAPAPSAQDDALIDRLAVKAQLTAVEFGADGNWQDARERAEANLGYVEMWAETGRRPMP